MPVAYNGLHTNTQAPSVAPEPEGTLTVNLPADADPPNASTFIQGYKVLADFIDWVLKGPKGKIATTAAEWARSILKFRAANGHTRFRIDHLALPAGRIHHWRENWANGVNLSGTNSIAQEARGVPVKFDPYIVSDLLALGNALVAASSDAGFITAYAAVAGQLGIAGAQALTLATRFGTLSGHDPWLIKLQQTTGSSFVNFFPPDSGTISARHPWVGMGAGDSAGDFALLYRNADWTYSPDITPYLEFNVALEAAAMGGKLSVAAGWSPETTGPHSGAPANYAAFTLAPGGSNWICSHASGGATGGTDSGVAAVTGTWTRFRIEFHGATEAEDTTRTVRYYINGALVATVTADLPTASSLGKPFFSLVNTAGGAHGLTYPLRFGPVQGASNLYPGDVQ